jgi:hypothetical protein
MNSKWVLAGCNQASCIGNDRSASTSSRSSSGAGNASTSAHSRRPPSASATPQQCRRSGAAHARPAVARARERQRCGRATGRCSALLTSTPAGLRTQTSASAGCRRGRATGTPYRGHRSGVRRVRACPGRQQRRHRRDSSHLPSHQSTQLPHAPTTVHQSFSRLAKPRNPTGQACRHGDSAAPLRTEAFLEHEFENRFHRLQPMLPIRGSAGLRNWLDRTVCHWALGNMELPFARRGRLLANRAAFNVPTERARLPRDSQARCVSTAS